MRVVGLTLIGLGGWTIGVLNPLPLPEWVTPIAVILYLVGCFLALGKK